MFPEFDPGAKFIDRLLIAAAVCLLTGPLVIYAWIMLGANAEAQTLLALDFTQSTAALFANHIDIECESARGALSNFAARGDTRDLIRSRNGEKLKRHLAGLASQIPQMGYAATYDTSGSLIARTSSEAPTSLLNIEQAPQSRPWFASVSLPSASPTSVHSMQVFVPVRSGETTLGYMVASFPLRQPHLSSCTLYLAREDGRIVQAIGDRRVNVLQNLKNYVPMRFALHGETGSVQAPNPDNDEDVFAGFAPAHVPNWGIVVAQPQMLALSPPYLLIQRLSLLLVPILGLAFAWAWNRVGSTRQIEALARRLSDQNERLLASDRARSQFLANVSHDLRTPLTCVQMTLSGLLEPDTGLANGPAGEALQFMDEEIGELSRRVENLLEMSRLESGAGLHYETCDMTAIVAAALERLAPMTHGRTIDADFPSEPLLLEGDQAQLETVLVNLVSNCVKFSPEGTTIALRGRAHKNNVTVTICDEGPGIVPGDEERIFDKFYRSTRHREVQGTGLGLAICKAIVEAHGGTIRAQSRADRCGAEFTVILPIAERHL